jgi:opacity protein-like surface antigen
MLRKSILLVMVLCLSGIVLGQSAKVLEFEVGFLKPKDIKRGMIYSAKYGLVVDERVDISFGVDLFHSSYSEEATVEYGEQGQVGYETKTLALDYSALLLPLSLNATARFPLQPPLSLYAGAGFSYQFLFNKVTNYEDDKKETQKFHGMGWIFRGGVEYGLGSKSSLIVETFYDLGKVKRNLDESTDGLPRWDEVNLGGFGFRAGLKMELSRY